MKNDLSVELLKWVEYDIFFILYFSYNNMTYFSFYLKHQTCLLDK